MLLEARHITKIYASARVHAFKALDDVSLSVDQGECVGVVGPSGSGKSTLIKIIAGLEQPNRGTVSFDGVTRDGVRKPKKEERAQIRAAWLNMQMIFQNPEASFLPSMTMAQAIKEGAVYKGAFPRNNTDDLVKDALEAVGLPVSFAQKHAFEMSGGECQRAAIARAIIGNPKLILCDEPTSALDVTVQAKIMSLLAQLHEERGMSLVFISHNKALVNNLCSRIYRLENGRIIDELVAE